MLSYDIHIYVDSGMAGALGSGWVGGVWRLERDAREMFVMACKCL
jgi:hypothetical protein